VTLESPAPGPESPAPGPKLPAPGPKLPALRPESPALGPESPAPAPASESGPVDWDPFVAGNQRATYLQTTAWGAVKRPNGWEPVIRESRIGPTVIGAQFLLRQPRAMPWVFAYAPRGPIADPWTGEGLVRWASELRERPWPGNRRVSHVRIEPEIEADGSDLHRDALAWLRRAGFRAAPAIQPTTTRLVDLGTTEEALWSDLRKKWRQYVNKARAGGVAVMDVGGDRLPEFHAIMTETAARTGTRIRALSAYEDVWRAFRPSGNARLLFACGNDGRPQAALFLVRCGTRVVEPYGGMTAAGAASRANYLLKWEAIRTSRDAGCTSYDMWGLVNPGIARFKAGFGGREVHTIGAWDLDLRPVGAAIYRLGEAVARRRRARRNRSAPGVEGPPTNRDAE
jgi:lipid II:glycine glycyltransferase (peptidoglycan interpeptide bridge formation enzyme)